ncbi:MAG: alpha/beta hydrolase [Flavobacteriales bacterium]|jgi:pimeloyl-ACP methyl ester carboxylesterase|nr:alpha/beta hydrolase [Flavobacteriales bacterium]
MPIRTLFLLMLLSSAGVMAQPSGLVGHWSGSFIRSGNSTQAVTVDVAMSDSGLVATVAIPEWIGYRPTTGLVEITEDVFRFAGPYGRVSVVLDSVYGELVGACGFAQVHLKRAVAPTLPAVVRRAQVFDLGDIRVEGAVVRPVGSGPFTTVVLVQGRGCGTQEGFQRRPEVYAQHGLQVVTYNKRGGEGDARSCDQVTILQHAADLARIVAQVKKLPGTGAVGVIAESAGAWAAYRASAVRPGDIAFLVTVAGAATSVRQQQLDCATYYVRDELGLDARCVEQARRYTELQYGADRAAVYAGLTALLDSARSTGWIDVLDASDIPQGEADIDALWVRNNDYDPTADIRAFTGPVLALLGGADKIVPWRENQARFLALFAASGRTDRAVEVISGAGHSMEHGHQLRDLGYSAEMNAWNTYFKFDRVDPRPLALTLDFLRRNGLLHAAMP